jgi:hypothetical protein
MTKFKTQTRWFAITSAAVAAVLLSGCATNFTPERRLERWKTGESKDFALVRGVYPLNPAHFKSECFENKLSAELSKVLNPEALPFIVNEVCPNFAQWMSYRGFIKSDFYKGAIIGGGFIRPGLKVEVDDIIEVSNYLGDNGLSMRPDLVTRVIRKNALKERDPTCYWDGQSGRFDSFATGGVVCPAEGWDWRDQKWSKK